MPAYALASKPCSGATNIDYFLLRIRPFYCKIKSSSKVFLKELFHPSICDSLIGSAYFNFNFLSAHHIQCHHSDNIRCICFFSFYPKSDSAFICSGFLNQERRWAGMNSLFFFDCIFKLSHNFLSIICTSRYLPIHFTFLSLYHPIPPSAIPSTRTKIHTGT